MRRAILSLVMILIMVVLASPSEACLVTGRAEGIVEVHNPLLYRPASLTSPGSPPFVPSDIRRAYDFLPLYAQGINGTGTRIAIIDAYGSSSLSSDLASFDSLTGLPAPMLTTSYPDGPPGVCRRGVCVNWAVETSLDVEWAHAIAPQASIDLVVALDASLIHVFDAISYVANSLPSETVVSMSFGALESSYPPTGSGSIAATHQLFSTMTGHGTTPFASSGDSGASSCCAPQYPASDPLVVAVGGTSLSLNSTAGYVGETAWSGSGAGSSLVFAKPAYQQGLGDNMRDDVDVSYNADPSTGVLVIQGGAQFAVGGTSAGSPQWAALIALASQANATRFGSIHPQLYKLTNYHDITSGSNGFFSASLGWDYPTGLGTPDAASMVSAITKPAQNATVTRILASRDFAYSGVTSNPIVVNVTVSSSGATTGTFTLTLLANSTKLGNQTLRLPGGATKTVAFAWNTEPFARGNYSLSAHVSLSPGGPIIPNSSLASPTSFAVRLAGDVNNDCSVNIVDLSTVGATFGLTVGSPRWNPNADLNNDGLVNLVDLVVVASHFGKHC